MSKSMVNPIPTHDVGLALIAGDAKNSNLVFSPLSFHATLSLVTAGADGAIKEQLLSFPKAESSSLLHSLYSDVVAVALADGSSSGGPKVTFVNGLWVDKSETLKPAFKQLVENVYKAEISQVSFKNKEEMCKKVNSWIKEKTEGLIKDVLKTSSISDLTRLVLANALYFKGLWVKKFDLLDTRMHNFYHLDGSSMEVPFMTNYEKQFVCAYNGFKVLRLPYEQGNDITREFSMYILLPDSKDGLPALVEKVCSKSGFLERHIPRYEVSVGNFRIPKFKISYKFEASNLLVALGLELPFEYEGGGLTEMVDTKLIVSEIIHEAFIDVDEQGTEAAAITEVDEDMGCSLYESPPRLINFVADHPFMYVLREDKMGGVLFIGQVISPNANTKVASYNPRVK